MGRHQRLCFYFQTLVVCLICLWPELSVPLTAQTHHYIYLASAASHTFRDLSFTSQTARCQSRR
jgi:hypothetical protein